MHYGLANWLVDWDMDITLLPGHEQHCQDGVIHE